MIGPAGTKSVEQLIENARDELTDRVETAITALKGIPLEQPEDPNRIIPLEKGIHQQFVVEHPTSRPENPAAALLGHISEAERRYIAAHDLIEHVQDPQYQMGDRNTPRGIVDEFDIERELHTLRDELRGDAAESIQRRITSHQLATDLEHNPQGQITDSIGDSVTIKDPATGWQRNISFSPYQGESEKNAEIQMYLDNAPADILESTRRQIIDQ